MIIAAMATPRHPVPSVASARSGRGAALVGAVARAALAARVDDLDERSLAQEHQLAERVQPYRAHFALAPHSDGVSGSIGVAQCAGHPPTTPCSLISTASVHAPDSRIAMRHFGSGNSATAAWSVSAWFTDVHLQSRLQAGVLGTSVSNLPRWRSRLRLVRWVCRVGPGSPAVVRCRLSGRARCLG